MELIQCLLGSRAKHAPLEASLLGCKRLPSSLLHVDRHMVFSRFVDSFYFSHRHWAARSKSVLCLAWSLFDFRLAWCNLIGFSNSKSFTAVDFHGTVPDRYDIWEQALRAIQFPSTILMPQLLRRAHPSDGLPPGGVNLDPLVLELCDIFAPNIGQSQIQGREISWRLSAGAGTSFSLLVE